MNIRKSTLSLTILAQALAFAAPAALAEDSSSAPAAAGSASVAHQTIQGVQERLTEADATIAALEQSAAQLQGDVRVKADAALKALRAKRDAYQAQAETAAANAKNWTEAQSAEAGKALDEDWAAFESARDGYLEDVKPNLATRRAVLNAELDARLKSWQHSIEDLRARAGKLSADQRAGIDARIAALKAKVGDAKIRIGRLEEASGEAWQTAQKGLSEAQKVFSDSYVSIRKIIDDAAK